LLSAARNLVRSAILTAADNQHVRDFVTRYGMQLGAGRFVAGEQAEQLIAAAERANRAGFAVAATILGEDTRDDETAAAVGQAYCDLLAQISQRQIDATLSVKLTHLGLAVNPSIAYENVKSIAATAKSFGNFIRLDMEQSSTVDETLSIYRQLRDAGFDNVGFVLQAYLYRSNADLAALIPTQPNIRIVKGAYLEPASIAYQDKADVDESYMRLLARSLREAKYTAIATHDFGIQRAALALMKDHQIPKSRFEFQLLYGIREDLARELLAEGCRVRLLISFGPYWFSYLMRRLAERPENLAFFLRNAIARS